MVALISTLLCVRIRFLIRIHANEMWRRGATQRPSPQPNCVRWVTLQLHGDTIPRPIKSLCAFFIQFVVVVFAVIVRVIFPIL